MKILIAEDDFIARRILKDILSAYGDCDIVVDGHEAVQAFRLAHEENTPYDLVCMDIMMPNTDGQQALVRIRDMEKRFGIRGSAEVRVIMITALDDPKNVFHAYYNGVTTAYLVKPFEKERLVDLLRSMGLSG